MISAVRPWLIAWIGLLLPLWAASVHAAGVPSGGSALTESQRARLHYFQHCLGCHHADGGGAPEKGVPSMRGLLPRIAQLPEGRAYLVQVPGVANSPLKDGDIARMLNWLVPEMAEPAQPGAVMPPYTEAEVTRWRSTPLLDAASARRHLIERLERAPTSATQP